MPDSERELRMKHTSEGAEKVRADLDKITKGEEDVKGKADDLGKATEDLSIKKENLTSVLRGVHPALGGLADGLINAAELAGGLGSANLNLNHIMTVGRSLILKYKDALLLLGAGGAAFLAIQMLIQAWKDLAAAEREALEAAQDFQKQQSEIAEQSEATRRQIGLALIEQTGGQVTDEEITRAHAEYRRYIREYEMEPGRAMRIVLGEEPPPTQRELDAQRRLIGGGYAERMRETRWQAMQAAPTEQTTGTLHLPRAVYTGDVRRLRKFVEERVDPKMVQDVMDEMAETMAEWMEVVGPSPDAYSSARNERIQAEARRMLLELSLTEKNITPSSVGQPRPKVTPDLAPAPDTPSAPGPEAAPTSDRDQRETSETLKQAAMLQRESAQAINEATRNLATVSDEFSRATERANQNRLRHGTTPRREAIAMREG